MVSRKRQSILPKELLGLIVLWTWAALAQTAVPTLDSFIPTQGPPGTPITILGQNLGQTTDVLIGTKKAVFQVLSASRILATVPREAHTGTIQIVTPSGIAVSQSAFIAAPFIEELNPEFGAPNESIVIFGRNLSNATAVHFGDVEASFIVLGETQLRAQVPSTIGLKTVQVTTPVGTARSETPFEATGRVPFVREFRPEQAPPGTIVTVEGKNFLGTRSFFFGTTPAPFVVTADTQLQLTIPAEAQSGPVTLTNGAGESTSRLEFIVLGTTPFVTEIIPDIASPGELITLEGINFTGTTAVAFGDANAVFSVTADTQIQVTVPAGASTGPLQFESTQGESTSNVIFTVNTSAPHIEDFEPLTVRGGELLRVNGRNFRFLSSVLIGEVAASFVVVADNQLSITVPPSAMTGPITLTNPGGITVSTLPLVVTGPEPSITTLDPTAGMPGDLILIDGGNFATATRVWFGNWEAEFSIVADNQLQAVVPNETITSQVHVDNPGGRATSPELFFLPARIGTITPPSGTPGDTVMIAGTSLIGATEVLFGDVPGTITESTPNQLIVTVPDGARIGPVAITNPAGITGSTQVFGILPSVTEFDPVAAPVGAEVTIRGRGLNEVTSIHFGPIPAPFEIQSSQKLVATVPINAVPGPLTLSNPVGTAVTSSEFKVIAAADLALSLQLSDGPYEWMQAYTMEITISSQGPSTVANGRLTLSLPPGSLPQSGANTHGTCSFADNVMTCNLVNLGATETATIQFNLLPLFYGEFDGEVTLDSGLFDPTPDDQSATYNLTVLGPLPSLTITKRDEDTLGVSWPKAAFDFQLEQLVDLTSADWQAVPPPFQEEGNQWLITRPRTDNPRFFRLSETP